jgi:hypothetical protein
MSELYETIIHRFSEKIKPNQEIKFYENSDKIAVIVDPRYDALMEAVIRQHMFFLNPNGWNLMVVSHSSYADKIRADFPQCIFAEINDSLIYFKDEKPNITIDGYNSIFLSTYFWSALPAENIFVFQKDCFMYKMFDEKFMEYDYVGARSVLFTFKDETQFLITNGGLSLRKKTAMIDCIKHISFEQLHAKFKQPDFKEKQNLYKKNEDIFFSFVCIILGKKTPEHTIQPEFAVEAEYNSLAAGHHGWNKYYHTQKQIIEILSENPNYRDLL